MRDQEMKSAGSSPKLRLLAGQEKQEKNRPRRGCYAAGVVFPFG
jgi:hypothetical protein